MFLLSPYLKKGFFILSYLLVCLWARSVCGKPGFVSFQRRNNTLFD